MANKSTTKAAPQAENAEIMEGMETKAGLPKGHYVKDGVEKVVLNGVSTKMLHDVQNDDIIKRVSIESKESPTGFVTLAVATANGVDSTGHEVQNQVFSAKFVEQDAEGNYYQGKTRSDRVNIMLGSPDETLHVGVPVARMDAEGKPVLNSKTGKQVYDTDFKDVKAADLAAQFYAAREEYVKNNPDKVAEMKAKDSKGSKVILRGVNVAMVYDKEKDPNVGKYMEAAAKNGDTREYARVNFTGLPSDISPTGNASAMIPLVNEAGEPTIRESKDRDRYGRPIDNTNYRDIEIGHVNEKIVMNVQAKETQKGSKDPSTFERRYVACTDLQKGFNAAKKARQASYENVGKDIPDVQVGVDAPELG